MEIILGVLFHFIGGFASGSFYIPYKKIEGWAFETYWIVGGIFSWLIVPPLTAWLTIPNFTDIIGHTSISIIGWTYLMGSLWGVGGLCYGLAVRYIGVSLGSTIILGLCSVVGALIPSFYYNLFPQSGKDNFTDMLHTLWGQMVLVGLLLCVVGIIICGRAGLLKERELTNKDAKSQQINKDYRFAAGIVASIVSGVLSACFSFGIETGKTMADVANQLWQDSYPGQGNSLFQNNVTYVVILWGGLTTNFVWCMVLNVNNKTFSNYIDKTTPLLKNYLYAALAGTMWFLQFFFYGMGESKLGNGASSWILHMAFIILIANVWGIVLKEWRGVSKKVLLTLLAGIAVIVASVAVVGYGNSIK